VRKPPGPTSHDVVDAVRRALGVSRVGHLGTLDPFAAGVLVVVVGRATRLARFAADWTKSYEGAIRLGVVTTTDDATGRVLATSEAWRGIGVEAVSAALAGLRGAYAQRPPAFSALKVAGERAYRRARRGEAPVLAPRPVQVHELALTACEPPLVRFRAVVGPGTYLRSLARDAGEALGCGAHLAELLRTAVGPFDLAQAVAPEAVGPGDLRDPAVLVSGLARRALSSLEREEVAHGRAIPAGGPAGPVALFADERLVAVAEVEGERLRPRVVLAGA
jgi:tRNA pseudouridine55 synthase